ncbi:MAG: NAD-dependent DNA ligase LigA [Lachnospiraceae bacterium]|nr:NAD-dependent DNA ligase LigA [Lachnospiraceae bacterium]
MREEYQALVAEIRRHMKKYYDEDEPEISDYEYDRLMLRLKEIERAHPEWVSADSPTRIVGASARVTPAAQEEEADTERKKKRTAGVTVTHDVPMLSIEDVFTREEVADWVHEVLTKHPDAVFCVEEKIDGLSMSLRYEKGKLVMAETRGDGFTGEDVTVNARVVSGVPLSLKKAYDSLEVRGEVYMTHEDFERTNALQEARGKKIFANPRNCAAGTLRILDSAVTGERGLSFFVHNVQRASDDTLMRSHAQALTLLAGEEGFRIAPHIVCNTADEVLHAIDTIGARRGELPYDIDGAVVKIDRVSYRADFPAGSKYSAGHIAYKYPPEEKEARITGIELTVGMTGRINPTAVFTPIRLCGTTVSRATLHNQDFIDRLGIGIGKTVLVYKSGEIIPKIRGTVTDGNVRTEEEGIAEIAAHASRMEAYRKEHGIFRIPSACPVCGGAVQNEKDGVDLYCSNPDCPAKLVRRIIHFVSRDAMDIKGFGAEYVTALIKEGYIRNIADIYTLYRYRDELVEKGLIGKDKNTDKLLKMIEASAQNEPWRLLCGLAIANVGRTSARTLMRHFRSIDALSTASVQELTQVEDIGEITAGAIAAYFRDAAHREMLDALRAAGVRMETAGAEGQGGVPTEGVYVPGEGTSGAPSDPLSGRTYVVTGDLRHFKNREELVDLIEAHGGKVAGSVSKKTTALINNDAASTSGKNKKAKELGIPVITEEEFLSAAHFLRIGEDS